MIDCKSFGDFSKWVEPAHPFGHWCLRPTRLPIPPSGPVVAAGGRALLEIGSAKVLQIGLKCKGDGGFCCDIWSVGCGMDLSNAFGFCDI